MLPVHRRTRHSVSNGQSIDNGTNRPSSPPSRKAQRFVRRRKQSRVVIPQICCDSSKLSPQDRARRRRLWLRLQKSPRFFALVVLGAACLILLLIVITAPLLPSLGGSSGLPPSSPIVTDHGQKQKSSLSQPLRGHGTTDQTKLFGRITPSSPKPAIPILFNNIPLTEESDIAFPEDDIEMEVYYSPDFGRLKLDFYDEPVDHRIILRDLKMKETRFRHPDQEMDDDVDFYYYFDDDELRGLRNNYDEDEKHNYDIHCRRVSDHRLNFPNCNQFHELDRLDPITKIKYLAAGAFREVFSVSKTTAEGSEKFVVKDILYANWFTFEDFEYVRMDAIVAERLTASPRIYDIYGYCGLGIMSEYFYHGDVEKDFVYDEGSGYIDPLDLHDKEEVKPQNNLTGIEKLVISLEMAEALADLHGSPNSLIIHDDVQMSQFLFNKDKTRLKLNDFNRAEIPLYDEVNGQYCRYKNGHGHGNWRSPEEYQDQPLTEQIDVWSLCCNMYALLTGLNPLYDIDSDRRFARKIIQGKVAYIDPRYKTRSPGEEALSMIIPKCFEYKPQDRPSIFQIVNLLQVAVSAALGHGATRQTVLEGIYTNN